MFRNRDLHVHFVGIGGIGMSGIAEVLCNLGYAVTGTDLNDTETTRKLAGLGATIHRGHGADRVADVDVVVVSSAIPDDNPEVLAARSRHIPVIPRAEMLAELMRLKQGLLIAGSHGKTTTTSLVAHALHAAGLDPTVVIGGKVNAFDSNARLGFGDCFVAEADESDGSFLMLFPTLAVITNIDAEHLEHYGTMEALLDAFVGFANRVPFYGQVVACLDDPNVRSILPRIKKRVVTYGLDPQADYHAREVRPENGHMVFRVFARGQDEGEFMVRMPGVHNVLNALASIALCDEQQVHREITREALASFEGVQRRFTVRGEVGGVMVVDDYGHHPTELQATFAGARTSYAERRLVAAFQPHRYSRVRNHLDAFAAALTEPDLVILTDIYAAGEKPLDGVDSQVFFDRVKRRRGDRPTLFCPAVDDLAAALAAQVREGDLVITLGAGSITHASTALVKRLGEAPA